MSTTSRAARITARPSAAPVAPVKPVAPDVPVAVASRVVATFLMSAPMRRRSSEAARSVNVTTRPVGLVVAVADFGAVQHLLREHGSLVVFGLRDAMGINLG